MIAGNLDCEVEWRRETERPRASGLGPREEGLGRQVAARLALFATTLRVYAQGEDELWVPAPVHEGWRPEGDDGPAPRLVWGPVPMDARVRWADDARFASAERAAIARAVNDRRFAAALAAELGVALPGARVVTSVDELAAHLAAGGASASPTGAWVAKAMWTAAGRDRVRRIGDALDDATRTRLARLLAAHGALVFEPWMARTLDVGQGGHVDEAGAVSLLPPHRGLVDDGGVVRGIVVDDGAALEPGERALLADTARAAGRALAVAGYTGPFVVDAFVHEHGGVRALHPLCELNARLTFGLVARAWAERRGAPLALGLGGPLPAGATPLVLDERRVPAAWVADVRRSP